MNAHAELIPGKICTKTDTTDVTFNVPLIMFTDQWDFYKMQKKVKYLIPDEKQKTIKPTEGAELQFFISEHDTVRLIALEIRGVSAILFLKQDVNGFLKLLRYYSVKSSTVPNSNYSNGVGHGTTTRSVQIMEYVIQRGTGTPVRFPNIGFEKNITNYFYDCPALVEIIKKEDLGKTDMRFMVDYFNEFCR